MTKPPRQRQPLTDATARTRLKKQRRFLILISLAVIGYYWLGVYLDRTASFSGFGLRLTSQTHALLALRMVLIWAAFRYWMAFNALRSEVWRDIVVDANAEDARLALRWLRREANRLAKRGELGTHKRPVDVERVELVAGESVQQPRGAGGRVGVFFEPDYSVLPNGGRSYPRAEAWFSFSPAANKAISGTAAVTMQWGRWRTRIHRAKSYAAAAYNLPAVTEHLAPAVLFLLALAGPFYDSHTAPSPDTQPGVPIAGPQASYSVQQASAPARRSEPIWPLHNTSEAWTTWATFALVMTALAQIGFFWRQLYLMRGSLADTKTAAEAAKQSADTAQQQLVSSLRAYVHFSDLRIVETVPRGEQAPRPQVRAVWKNHGKVPATNVRLWYWFLRLDTELPADYAFEVPKDAARTLTIIPPGAEVLSVPDSLQMNFDLTPRNDGSGRFIYVWGVADYSDGIAKTDPRTTKFCVRVVGYGVPKADWPDKIGAPQVLELKYHDTHNEAT